MTTPAPRTVPEVSYQRAPSAQTVIAATLEDIDRGAQQERLRLSGLILARLSRPLDQLLQQCREPALMRLLQTSQLRLDAVLDALQAEAQPLGMAAEQWQQEFLEGCEAAGIAAECLGCDIDRPLVLDAHARLAVARTIREATVNIVRHSAATSALLVLNLQPHQLSVEVHDDGLGRVATIVHGRGLLGMQRRAFELDGQFSIGDSRGGGLCLRLTLPLSRPAQALPSPVQGTPPMLDQPSIATLSH